MRATLKVSGLGRQALITFICARLHERRPDASLFEFLDKVVDAEVGFELPVDVLAVVLYHEVGLVLRHTAHHCKALQNVFFQLVVAVLRDKGCGAGQKVFRHYKLVEGIVLGVGLVCVQVSVLIRVLIVFLLSRVFQLAVPNPLDLFDL